MSRFQALVRELEPGDYLLSAGLTVLGVEQTDPADKQRRVHFKDDAGLAKAGTLSAIQIVPIERDGPNPWL